MSTRLKVISISLAIPALFLIANFNIGATENEEFKLPRLTRNAAEFDVLANQAFYQCTEILKERLNARKFKPELVKFTDPKEAEDVKMSFSKEPEDMVGFVSTLGYRYGTPVVLYQNIYELSDKAIEINKQVVQVNSREELIPYGELMLYWYIAHELIHSARNFVDTDSDNGWYEEFVANTMQPYLTDAALRKYPDAPYKPELLHAAYDRSVRVLRKVVSDETFRRTESFTKTSGLVRPSDKVAFALFRTDVPAYVYIGVRVTQASVNKNTSLENLIEKYLNKKSEESD